MKSPLRQLRSGGAWPLNPQSARKVQSPFSEAESGDSPLIPQAAGGAGQAVAGATAAVPSGQPLAYHSPSEEAAVPGAAPTCNGDRAGRPASGENGDSPNARGGEGQSPFSIYIIDTETQHLIGDRPISQLGVACLCIYDVAADRYIITDPNSSSWAPAMTNISNADLVIGWHVQFDLEVLSPWIGKVWPLWAPDHKTLGTHAWDPLLAIRNAGRSGKAGSLGDVAMRTLGEGKMGEGSKAPALWRAQRYAELHTYCMQDVRLVRNLLRYIKQNGYVMTANGRVNLRLPRELEAAL